MLEFICFNHKITRVSEAHLPAASAAAFYGRGVFTTVAVGRGEAFQWEKHWRRLKSDAARINLNLSDFKEKDVKNSLAATVAANDLSGGRARLTFFDQASKGIWDFRPQKKNAFLICVARNHEVSNDLRLTVSPHRANSLSPLAGVKSCNYLENLLALERAKGEGFDEAVRLNERSEIVSACMANVFWVKNGEIFTPRLETAALAGTTRAFVLENFSVGERRAAFDELNESDEVFLTSAGIGIARVASVGEITYAGATVFERVRKSYFKAFEI